MKKKTHILVGICSGQNQTARRAAVRDTWLRRPQNGVDCLFFVGGEQPPAGEENDTVALPARDDYGHLPEKVLAFFRYALEHYDFDWLFKCDDDTYVCLDRLPSLGDPAYGLIGDEMLGFRDAPSGGAGYMLTRSMVGKIAAVSGIPAEGAEDLIFGRLALHLGANPCVTDRLCRFATPYPLPGNEQVTVHWCTPDMLRHIDSRSHHKP